MHCGDLYGQEVQKGGQYIYIYMADSSCCTIETHITLESNHTTIKINLKKEITMQMTIV